MFSAAKAALVTGIRVRVLASFFFVIFAASANATPLEAGSDFLLQSQRADGALSTANDIATAEQATAEALLALEATGAIRDAGLAFLENTSFTEMPTEYLARYLIVKGGGNAGARNALLERQNVDGGFGATRFAASSVLDTTFALRALSSLNLDSAIESERAVAFLLANRSGAGWPGPGGAADAAASLLAWHALFPFRHRFDGLAAILDAALGFLDTTILQDDFLVAMRLRAKMLRAANEADYQAALNAFLADQRADGSWSGDVFSTALALQVLTLANLPSPNPDLGSISGRVVDAEYGTVLAGVEVALGSERAATTDSNGEFRFRALSAGEFELRIEADGYGELTAALQLRRGQQLDLGDVALLGGDVTGAILRGTVSDAGTGAPLADAQIAVGADPATTTNANGQFSLTAMPAGSHVLVISRTGYENTSVTVALDNGATHVIAIGLNPRGSGRFTVQGTVSDGETGQALAGATINVGGDASGSAITGLDGSYRLSELPTGSISLSTSLEGYRSATASAEVRDGQTLNYSPRLYPEGSVEDPAQQAGVSGALHDITSELPLANVNVRLVSLDGDQTASTDAQGRFEIEAHAGAHELEFSLEGYRESVRRVNLVEGVVLDLGEVHLSPDDFYPAITVSGIVLDSTTNEALPGADIVIAYDDSQHGGSPAADGRFAIVADGDRNAKIRITAAGYRSVEWETVLPAESIDLGQLRLRPEGLDELRPDITLALHDLSARDTDPATLLVSGTVVLEAANIGKRTVDREFDVVAFMDLDGDGRFNSEADIELGRTIHNDGLAPDTTALVEVEVRGSLPFRDAPIHFAADPDNHIIELRDDNNFIATLDACRIRPERGEFNPVEKWRWAGGRVTMTPLAAPLMDTNSDGVVDINDDIFIVFIFSSGFPDNAAGTLVAVNGRTGEEAWRFTQISFNAPSQLAIGDIDGDGFPEIVGSRYRTGLVAINGDGTFKWQSNYPDYRVGLNYGGPILADLDADGYSEIIIDKTVLNYDGTLRWVGSEPEFGGQHSIVADIDLDGHLEVIVGPTVYDANGNLIWRAPLPDGRVGIGNFDGSPYPGIIIVGGRSVYMLDHEGEIVWGPVIVSRRGGGAPTIGDVDGDGVPEIGVAGDFNYYVINADGSIRWQYPIFDPSEQTGSTFFDFDGDNRVEVVYFDQSYLRVFDGDTGSIVFQIPNQSVTAREYAIVVDIDNDSHAELVVPSYNNSMGIRAFEDERNSWVNARRIWNQYSYHITNINDDMSIPAVPENNWETFNNFRVNAVPDPTRVADLTASLFSLQDQGPGQPLKTTLRVGNGGGYDAHNVMVTIYTAHPDSGGTVWADATVPLVAAGGFVDVELDGNNLPADPLALHAEVNSNGNVPECFAHNNSMTLPAIPVVGEIAVTPGASIYRPDSDTLLTAVAHNTGSFTRAFEAQLRIEDGNGNVVVEFPSQALGELASGAQRVVQENWNTARTLAGDYLLRGNLYAADGELLASSTAPFEVRHDASAAPLAALRLATDRARYHSSDQVRLDLLAQNRSVSTLLNASSIRLTVNDPAGELVFDQVLSVRELAAGNHENLFATQILNAAAVGDYQLAAAWRAADDVLLAAAEGVYEVHEDLALALRGSVTVASPVLYLGENQVCTEEVTNTGTLSATVELRRTLARLDEPSAQPGSPFSATLAAGESETWLRGVDTAGMSEGDYACIIEAEIEGAWQPLASTVFRLLPPPIRVNALMQAGERGRLLVLLDPACMDLNPPEGEGGACDADPYGPADAPPLPIQRDHLEAVLEAAGWTYTIATSADSFAAEFNTEGYELYALFNEQLKLPEALQRDVVADIAAGRGLLVAGNHDNRNGRLQDALGVHSLGKNLDIEALIVEPLGEHEGAELQFFVLQRPNAIRLEGADVIGEYRLAPKGNKQPGKEPAITRHAHEKGTGIYAGFDWPVQSATEGDDGEFSNLLAATLGAAHPQPYQPVAGRTFPLTVTLGNEGMATAGQVHLPLPVGIGLVEGPPGTVVTDGIAAWTFALAEDEQQAFTVWLQLPDAEGPLALEAVILTGEGDELTEHTRAQIVLNVQAE